MPTQLPTKTFCLNCHRDLQKEDKFCPSCGQENADKRISLAMLLQDTLATAFNLESRFFRTLPAFLFKPGTLTVEFLAGRRVHYVHPFKVYLLSSLLFFFVFIKLSSPAIERGLNKINNQIVNDTTANLNVDINFDDVTAPKLDSTLLDSLENIAQKTKNPQLQEVLQKDSIAKYQAKFEKGFEKGIAKGAGTIRKKREGMAKFITWIQDKKMTKESLLDSLENNHTSINLFTSEQLLKIGRNDPIIFVSNTINNIGTLMFFTLPLLALFFVPFYLRRKKFYIDHLIFTLHLQAFTFILLTLVSLVIYTGFWYLSFPLAIILLIYVWAAFKKVYQQGFFKTYIKASIISTIYIGILLMLLGVDLIYSFYMF